MDSARLHIRRMPKRLLPLVALLLVASVASGAIFTTYFANTTATVKTPEIQLIAGADSSASPTVFPAATVTVASTFDYANVAFSLFPSAVNSPQPATYYTDLLQIKNDGAGSHTINSIVISSITGAANIGSITIYLYDTQTNSPQSGTPITSVTLTSASSGTITLTNLPTTIAAGDTLYIEVVGNAASTAVAASTVGFATAISWT